VVYFETRADDLHYPSTPVLHQILGHPPNNVRLVLRCSDRMVNCKDHSVSS
jgi:hypothetical protein